MLQNKGNQSSKLRFTTPDRVRIVMMSTPTALLSGNKTSIVVSGFLILTAIQFQCPALADNQLFEQGCRHLSKHDYDGALFFFDQVISADDNDAKAYFKRGQCFYGIGNMKQSLEDFERATLRDSKNSEYFLWRGTVHAKLGQDAEAVQDYAMAARLDPQLLEAYKKGESDSGGQVKEEQRGQEYQNTFNRDAKTNQYFIQRSNVPPPHNNAVTDYKEAMRLAERESANAKQEIPGKQTNASSNLQHRLLQQESPASQDRLKKIIDQSTDLIGREPTNANAYVNRAKAYHRTGQSKKAFDDFEKAINLVPNEPSFFLARAILYHDLKRDVLARSDIRRAQSLDYTLPKDLWFDDQGRLSAKDQN